MFTQIAHHPPIVQNIGGQLMVGIPLTNLGDQVAYNVVLNQVVLSGANKQPVNRVSPKDLPLKVGERIGQGNVVPVLSRFDARQLNVGGTYALNIGGTYDDESGRTYGFGLGPIEVDVPEPGPRRSMLRRKGPEKEPPVFLQARVDYQQIGPGHFRYRITNSDPDYSVVAFSLDLLAPIDDQVGPPGWTWTDYKKRAFWGTKTPIRAGQVVEGFEIRSTAQNAQSTKYALTGKSDKSAAPLAVFDYVFAPAH